MTPEGPWALSICQPSAWAICAGHKDVENRVWRTRFRGPFFVHATIWRDDAVERWMREDMGLDVPEALPKMAIIGRAEVYDCVRHSSSPFARSGAGGGPGMWRWLVRNGSFLNEPVEVRGRLGFWIPPKEVVDAINAQERVEPRGPGAGGRPEGDAPDHGRAPAGLARPALDHLRRTD